ncbi:MAG: TonB-dependent receptor, partial [Thermoplasmata archaeon]|nr:TonB-dependent receptor [Thermoplasmata archaeon]
IPGAVGTVISLGGAVHDYRNVFGALRLRYFGPRPLIEDNSQRSPSTSLVNGDVGYRLNRNVRLVLDVFNLLNSTASDVDYYYRSRLPGEPIDGVADIHTHPITGRTARLGLLVEF